MFDHLRTIYRPALAQAPEGRQGWFEGWYFKIVGAECGHARMAAIPGVSYGAQGTEPHAFVQLVLPEGHTEYHHYPLEQFSSNRRSFDVSVGPNRFTESGMTLDLPDTGGGATRGDVTFGPWRPWPVTVTAPGIMGWYRYVPRMECYHGVLSMDHELTGKLTRGSETFVFDGGRGYIEKDWGSGFPSSWIWSQCNHFTTEDGSFRHGTSLTFSIARIPWLGSSFTGHIAGVLHEGTLYRFATYTGSRITCVETSTGGAVATVADRRHELRVEITSAVTSRLAAPLAGSMVAHADESIGATVRMTLRDKRSERTLVDSVGRCAGAEIMNARDELQAD